MFPHSAHVISMSGMSLISREVELEGFHSLFSSERKRIVTIRLYWLLVSEEVRRSVIARPSPTVLASETVKWA